MNVLKTSVEELIKEIEENVRKTVPPRCTGLEALMLGLVMDVVRETIRKKGNKESTQDLPLKPEYLALWENAVCELRHCISNEYGENLCNKLENSMVFFAKGEYDKIKFLIGD